ncbi:hypothetical protein [Actinacidiphila oryziradicis]|uniref:Uncharacterized protein n=1 Tax=Actinacidiphila oryziradicis TaxID=2571141 RepID=A0A4U0RMS5_9ACTN|nr:hypothetical protein [Actinacidiphila oryziradicis]TJZ97125.1 hypothetical protein FCI23_49865 [Actinacidiphila oryziradicis]
MERMDYLGQSLMQAAVLPGRVAYLIAAGSEAGFRRALLEASSRWGGMTEPMVPVTPEGTVVERLRQMVRIAGVEAAVNVDVDPGVAVGVAADLGLVCVPIDQIRAGTDASWTCPPLQITGIVERPNAPLAATDESPLWQAAAAGYIGRRPAEGYWPDVQARPSGHGDDFGRSQLFEAVHILQSVEQFGEHHSVSPGHAPAVLWITGPDDVEDCLAFWNLRALRPVSSADIPMMLLPSDEVQHWMGFPKQLADFLGRRSRQFCPDVLLFSENVSQEQLHQIAGVLQLVPTREEVRAGVRWPEPPAGQAPFVYRCDVDPADFVLQEREYGLTTSFDVQVFSGESMMRFASPVQFHGPARALVRISGSLLEGLPRRAGIAAMIDSDAQWRGDGIQLRMQAHHSYLFPLTFPTLAQATARLLDQVTAMHSPSGPGRLGAALQRQTDIAALLEAGVYEAVIALTTPRSKELLKKLQELEADGEDDGRLIEIAATWGGRAERRYLPADALEGMSRGQAAGVAERLCALGWAERGLVTKCEQCGIRAFHPLHEAGGRARCPGCSAACTYDLRSDHLGVFYRLDSFADRASDNGVLPHLLVAAALLRDKPQSFFLPGTDLHFSDGTTEEVDLFGIYDGQVLSAEIKTSASAFTDSQLKRDVALSKRLGADIHLLAAMDTVPDDARHKADRLCREAGMKLLVRDRNDLRPAAAPPAAVTPADGLRHVRDAAHQLLAMLEKHRGISPGQAAKILKTAAGPEAKPVPAQIAALTTAMDRYGTQLSGPLQKIEAALDGLLDELAAPTADEAS